MREIVRVQGQELGRGLTRNGPHLNWRRVPVRADLNSDGCVNCTAVVPVKFRVTLMYLSPFRIHEAM
jgi:hypothetical protein